MTTHTNREAYYDEGRAQAVKLFNELYPRAKHGVTMVISAAELRQRLHKLPLTQKFKAALADLYLALDVFEGRARRKDEPPESPFELGPRKSLMAERGKLLEWDAAWRLKEAAQVIAQKFEAAGATEVQDYGRRLRQKLLWLVAHGQVLGSVDDMPVVALDQADVAELEVMEWTTEEALMQPWLDPDERALWVNRYIAGNRYIESAVQRAALEQVADAPPIADPPPLL